MKKETIDLKELETKVFAMAKKYNFEDFAFFAIERKGEKQSAHYMIEVRPRVEEEEEDQFSRQVKFFLKIFLANENLFALLYALTIALNDIVEKTGSNSFEDVKKKMEPTIH